MTTVISGARNEEQLRDNLAVASLRLTPEEMMTLDNVSELPAEYPGWMISRQGAGRAPASSTK